ncbi:MarR family transcriptional regulator [Gulosibacter macacae]|uniref:MarR family transcriptional regulator n=1 Tax=Gulosibacter macacae TaxID=2488791 RepID=A0A3P3W1G2_9MICO|nr:MarR family transcriptional regulator [Gulosibacter macacae]RRJ88624.1 MarR family transcriptional regulator [Gulosibacter macacae]
MSAEPESTRWLSNHERRAWMRLAAVLELLPATLDAQVRHDSELTHVEYYSLAFLSDQPGNRIQMSELAARTNSTLPRLSRVITALERAGLVERLPNESDARATDVCLTKAGRAKIVEAAPGHVSKVREVIFDPLRPDDVDELIRILDAWLDVLDPDQRMHRDPEDLPAGD